MQILAVNDSKLTLMALEGFLAGRGYRVLTAENGREAIDVLEKTSCQIVLLDWEMPVMDGPEFCREIRDRFYRRYIYIIFWTGHSDPKQKLAGLEAGADDFVLKSSSYDELIIRLRIAKRIITEDACPLAVRTIHRLLRLRCKEGDDHDRRVARCCSVLVRCLANTEKYRDVLDTTFRRRFFSACSIYNVGRIGLPDEILRKRERLSDGEFAMMKTHPQLGARVFEELLEEFPEAEFLRMARDIAATHHERYDGSGYPTGLKGESIPLAGRIVSVADTYDALISINRHDRSTAHDYAKWILVQGRHFHYDPDVVDAFLAGEDEFHRICSPGGEDIRIDL